MTLLRSFGYFFNIHISSYNFSFGLITISISWTIYKEQFEIIWVADSYNFSPKILQKDCDETNYSLFYEKK